MFSGGYIYNTEAHPIDTGALYCCSEEKKEDDLELENFHDNLDLLTLFDINENKDSVQGVKWDKTSRRSYLDEINYETLKFLNDFDNIDIIGNLGQGHQAVMSTKGEKFRVKEEKVVIDGFKGKVNNQDIEIKIVPADNAAKTEVDETLNNLKEVCDTDGTCRKVGLELNMKKYTKEENINDPDPPSQYVEDKEDIQYSGDDTAEDINAEFENELRKADSGDVSGDRNVVKDDTSTGNVNENVEGNTEKENDQSGKVEVNTGVKNKVSDTDDEKDQSIRPDKVDIITAEEEIIENTKTKGGNSDTVVDTNVKITADHVTVTQQNVNAQSSATPVSQQINVKSGTDKFKDVLKMIKTFTENYLSNDINKGVKSMKSLHDKLKYYSLFHRQNYEQLTCEAQPFHMKFSVKGEMFIID